MNPNLLKGLLLAAAIILAVLLIYIVYTTNFCFA